jgi:hypothetical protein
MWLVMNNASNNVMAHPVTIGLMVTLDAGL